MFILDQIHAREFSDEFIEIMDNAYFDLFKGEFNPDALLTHFYFT
jgi:hypothetical protein